MVVIYIHPAAVEGKMNVLAVPTQAPAQAKRDRRLYFWLASTGTALVGLVLYLLAPTADVVPYAVLLLAAAYVASWLGILLGKRD
jgi:hypothetical protein